MHQQYLGDTAVQVFRQERSKSKHEDYCRLASLTRQFQIIFMKIVMAKSDSKNKEYLSILSFITRTTLFVIILKFSISNEFVKGKVKSFLLHICAPRQPFSLGRLQVPQNALNILLSVNHLKYSVSKLDQ